MTGLRVIFCVAALALASTTATVWGRPSRLTVGTNPQGTMYYVVGGGVSKLLSDKLSLNVTAQPYAGSSVYLPLVQSNEVSMGISSALDSGMAYRGEGPYKKLGGLKKLRTIARLWALPYAFVARADSGLRTVADLKGKKVAVDLKANASLGDADRVMLEAGGLRSGDVQAVTINGLPEGYSLMSDGSIAAAPTALAIPLARKSDATIPGGIVMLDITGPDATTGFVSGRMKGVYIVKAKPGKNNPGVKKPINVLGFNIFLVVNANAPEDQVYKITRTLHENWKNLRKDYPVLRSTSPDEISDPTNTVPYAAGAVRYYKEAGLWSAKNAAHDAALGK